MQMVAISVLANNDFQDWMRQRQLRMEAVLEQLLPAPDLAPQRLHQAMRYAALGGGKRVRPLLAFAAGELSGAPVDRVETVAAAVELIHVYSLVHDDLPCMDDDELRRGKPTCHVQFDDATALLVGDSPIGSARHIEEYWKVTGFQEVCRRQGAELVAFEKSGVYKKNLNGRNYHIARPVLDAEVMINLPKLKSHSLTLLTCAVKNMYGAVPGLKKSMYHREAPLPMEFSKLLLDIYTLARPQLNIIDAVIGMDGNGPSAGDPKPIGMIMAGADGVAIDCLAAHLMGMDPLKGPTNLLARKINLGETQLENIERLGDAIEVRNDFQWPSTWAYSLIPSFLARHMAKLFWIRPAIDPAKCVNCGACVESCPTSAISSGEPTPVFNYKLCINCLCCQEICPQQAVHPRRSLIAKMVR